MDFPLNQSIENLDRKASKQSSFNSPGGEWRSFREALGEEDLRERDQGTEGRRAAKTWRMNRLEI